MSDVSQGPGWWQASDGKWYAPELHADYVPPPAPAAPPPPPAPTPTATAWTPPPPETPGGPGSSSTPGNTGSGRSFSSPRALPGIVIAAGALMVLGSLLPWATVSSQIGSISVDGTSGDGKLTLILGVIALVLGVALLQRVLATGWLIGTGVVFLVSLGISIHDVSNITSVSNQLTVLVGVHIGFGLWLCLLASIAGVVAVVLLFLQRRTVAGSQPAAATPSFGGSAPGNGQTNQPQPAPAPGWWQATDGQWYPPEAHPGTQGQTPPPSPPLG